MAAVLVLTSCVAATGPPAQGSGPATTGVAVTSAPAVARSTTAQPPPTTHHSAPVTPHSAPAPTPPLRVDDGCLRRDNRGTGATFPPGDAFPRDVGRYGEGAQLQRLYSVKSGILAPVDGLGAVRPCDAQLWSLVAAITPFATMIYVDELLVFDADLDARSANGFLTVGEVDPRGTDAKHWRLALAPNGATRAQLAELVAHEVGHLISLNNGQVFATGHKACTSIWTGSGCLSPGSFLLRFLNEEWTKEDVKEWSAASRTIGPTRAKALKAFYRKHAKVPVPPGLCLLIDRTSRIGGNRP